MIAMTASDIMTVAIAAERYVAVHYPLDYNQAKSCSNFERRLFRRETISFIRHKGTYGKMSLTVMKFPLLFGPPVVKNPWGDSREGKLQRGSTRMSDI